MQYVKTIWVDGTTPITAENLNNIENGVEQAVDIINEIETIAHEAIGDTPQNTLLIYAGADLVNVQEFYPDGTTLKNVITLNYLNGDLVEVITDKYSETGVLQQKITETLTYENGNLISVERSVV